MFPGSFFPRYTIYEMRYTILMPSPRVTLELRNAKSSELGPQAAEQILTALPTLKRPLIGAPEAVAFEIVAINQTITFQVNLPESVAHYFHSQLTAAYPAIVINRLPDDLKDFQALTSSHLHLTSAYLNFSNASYYPFKTYADFSDTDPLATILGLLSKLPPDQAAVIQILAANTPDSWKKTGFTTAAGRIASDGTHIPNPQKPQIEAKLNQTCHRTAIKLFAAAADPTVAANLLSHLATSFSSLNHAQSNTLKLKKPLLKPSALTTSLPDRSFKGTKKQYLSVSELATIWHLPYLALKDIKNITWGKSLLGEPPITLPTFDTTPEDKRDQVNLFATCEYKNQQAIYGIKNEDRRRHLYVMGKTGTGKSTLLGNMIINDLKHNQGVAVIDPHGDLVETVLHYIPSSRINDVVYLNPADPEYSVRLNPLEATGQEHKELVASGIIAIFQKLYAYSWGPRLEHILRNTLLTLLSRDQSTLEDIVKILTNPQFRKKITESLDDPVLKAFWDDEFANMGDKLRAEAVSPILNKVGQFVSSPLIRGVINHPNNSFSIQEIMDQGKILLVNLSQGKLGEDNSALLGAMLITKIQLTAMNRVYMDEEERRDFFMYVDEFQNFATTSFIKILSEARKYRLCLTLANQYIDQVDEDVRKAIFGNAGSIVTFLVGAQDAYLMSKEFGGAYTEEDLVSLGRFQIINKLSIDGMTSNPFPGFTLSLASSYNQNKDKVIRVSRERYAKKK